MSVYFKVWAYIERLTANEAGLPYSYEDVGQVSCLGEFDTFVEAAAFLNTMDAARIHYDNCPYPTGLCICGDESSISEGLVKEVEDEH